MGAPPIERENARLRGSDLLDLVGLSYRIDFRSAKLSGGQKQRVAVARALINKPELILADEPTGNLDSVSAQQVMDLLKRVNKSANTTLLISTHDEHIARQCAACLKIKDGQIS